MKVDLIKISKLWHKKSCVKMISSGIALIFHKLCSNTSVNMNQMTFAS